MRPLRAAPLLAVLAACAPGQAQETSGQAVRSERAAFRVTTFAEGLENPWGAAFLPDGRLLVTERPGRLRVVGREGAVSPPLPGVPEVVAAGQGGLLDVALPPDFAATRQVYLCMAGAGQGGALTRLAVARLNEAATALEGARTLLDAGPGQVSGRNHYGCRIAFGRDGKVYLSTGDRFSDKMRAQRLDDLAGKVLRLERDGRPAEGNPFAGRAGARPEIYSYGHRNPQGLAVNPWTGSLWEAEFGAQGGDEINHVKPGANYGWPLVSYGRDYGGGPIGNGESTAPGIEPALHFWNPAVSPSGIGFYDGTAFPGWRGSLLVAALNRPGLVRLSTEGDRVTGEERLLTGRQRFRQVLQGPDGLVYLLTDAPRGAIWRLEPAG